MSALWYDIYDRHVVAPCVANLHLVVEYARFAGLCGLNEMLIENLENVPADVGELFLDLLTVLFNMGKCGRIAFALQGIKGYLFVSF